jgi:hypothetical protein
MKFNRNKIFEIIITALIGAGIAFLQGLLSELLRLDTPNASPELAGLIGGAIRTIRT